MRECCSVFVESWRGCYHPNLDLIVNAAEQTDRHSRVSAQAPSACSGAQPANLSSMIDLVSEDVKPLEVVVDPLSVAKRRLSLEPHIIAAAKFQQRRRANLLEPCEVVREVVTSNLLPRPVAERKRGAPLVFLLRTQLTSVKRRSLVADFRRGDVRQQRADGITLRVRHV